MTKSRLIKDCAVIIPNFWQSIINTGWVRRIIGEGHVFKTGPVRNEILQEGSVKAVPAHFVPSHHLNRRKQLPMQREWANTVWIQWCVCVC